MTGRRQIFVRKIVYVTIIAVLLGGIAYLATPSTTARTGHQGSSGGVLPQLRQEAGLAQANLGELDPGSEGAKLATLGMRGVAVNVLWLKAQDYHKRKDWTNLSATLNQLMKLEPHFVSVWRYQGWNLSFNVSVEFDDFRERFRWVIRGIEFLKEGIRYNEREPLLYYDVGWYYGHKIGRADEHKQFRRLFTDPDDPYNVHHGEPPRDNWLVGKEWFTKAEDIVAEGAILRTTPLIFYSKRPMCQMNYAEMIEEEGTFGDRARWAWTTAWSDWVEDFGERELPSSDPDQKFRLADKERLLREVEELAKQIDALQPGLREEMVAERRQDLTPPEREALETPAYERTSAQHEAAARAASKLELTHEQVARRIRGAEKREKALELARRAEELERLAQMIDRDRTIVNYKYWERRAEVEQTTEAIAARENMYLARQAYLENDPLSAREYYEQAAVHWSHLLEEFSEANLAEDQAWTEELAEFSDRFMRVLDQADMIFPEDYPLAEAIRHRARNIPAYALALDELKQAEAARAEGDLASARGHYEQCFEHWRRILDEVPSLGLLADRQTSKQLMAVIRSYDEVLAETNGFFPAPFVLEDFVHVHVTHAPAMNRAQQAALNAESILRQGGDAEQLTLAKGHFDAALVELRRLLDEYPSLLRLSDRRAAREIAEIVSNYAQLLGAMGESSLPDDFPLQDFRTITLPRLQSELSGDRQE